MGCNYAGLAYNVKDKQLINVFKLSSIITNKLSLKFMPEFNEKVIPLVVKKGQSCQKFRIPFKNSGA